MYATRLVRGVQIASTAGRQSRLQLNWSLEMALAGRDVATGAASDCNLRARVTGHTTNGIRKIGGASVRLEFLHAPLQPGGWVLGLGAPNQNATAFLPAIGGAPGDNRHGLLEAMVLARPCFWHNESPSVTFLEHESIVEWLPVGTELDVTPVWQCLDFFNLRKLFDEADTDANGTIDRQELKELLERTTKQVPADAEVEDILRRADLDGNDVIDFQEFAESVGFADTRLHLQLSELAARAAKTIKKLHQGPPWHGASMHHGLGFEALLAGTGLAIQ